MPLLGWDLELWVGNAKQSAYFYERALGFHPTAYAGPETGVRDRASYVLEQGDARFVVTALSGPTTRSRGTRTCTATASVSFRVPDATEAYRQALQRGAREVDEPRWVEDEHGRVELASIATYGETIHNFVNREEYSGAYLPGYRAVESENGQVDVGVGLKLIDHVVGNVELGRMKLGRVLRALPRLPRAHALHGRGDLDRVLGAHEQGDDGRRRPLQASDQRAGGRQAQESDRGVPRVLRRPGVQHIAFATDDIVNTVESLRERGIRFLNTPDSYYEDVEERVGEIDEEWSSLRRLKILADRDDEAICCRSSRRRRRTGPPLLRGDREARGRRFRRGQLRGSLRGDRARAGAPRQPLAGPAAALRRGRWYRSPRGAILAPVRLCTFEADGRLRPGRVEGDRVVELGARSLAAYLADGGDDAGEHRLDDVRLRAPSAPPSVRDFYAFERHVREARAQRGLEVAPEWYQIPVFYFSNPAAISGPDEVAFPETSSAWSTSSRRPS